MARFVHLHGFGSSAASAKGVALARAFARAGVELSLLDLNRPSFARLSLDAALGAVDEAAAAAPEEPLGLIGSSLGGMLAARWAELHPVRAARLVLLCPGFDMPARWARMLGPNLERWRQQGFWPFLDAAAGVEVPVHWGLYEEALQMPAFPEVPCPTLLIHGSRDEVVPVEQSRRYAQSRPHVRLLEVNDDHNLMGSVDLIAREALAFFGVG